MGTNCTPLFAVLFLHAYEADFLQETFMYGSENI